MRDERFSRTELLLGTEGLEKLAKAHVAVFGIGGVGSFTVEALARSGVGKLTLVDKDTVDITNLNRQLIALEDTVGLCKADVSKARCLKINPDIVIETRKMFFLPETADQFDFKEYDYIVDAIDTVSGKLSLIEKAVSAGTPVISSMGAGNKLNPAAFEVADIYETSVCPLAKVMRRELKKRGIKHLKVVYSKEPPVRCISAGNNSRAGNSAFADCGETNGNSAFADCGEMNGNAAFDIGGEMKGNYARADCGETAGENKAPAVNSSQSHKTPPGSIAFVPSVAGLIIAGEVVRDLVML